MKFPNAFMLMQLVLALPARALAEGLRATDEPCAITQSGDLGTLHVSPAGRPVDMERRIEALSRGPDR